MDDLNNTILVPVNAVFPNDGKAFTSSRIVAEVFGKRHRDVLRGIRNLGCSQRFNERNFALVDYQDSKGETRPETIMTKDGFMFLVMGYTGKLAAQIKEAYIDEFNRMDEDLRRPALAAADQLALRDDGRSLVEAFLDAICSILRSSSFYLYPMGAGGTRRIHEYTKGRLFPLGRFDDDFYYIASYYAYEAYWKRAHPPAAASAINAQLAASGLIEINPKKKHGASGALWKISIDGTVRSVLKFRRDRVTFPIS